MITGKMFRDGVISASNNIANSRSEVDALNIFPVPDGDTGTKYEHDHRRGGKGNGRAAG